MQVRMYSNDLFLHPDKQDAIIETKSIRAILDIMFTLPSYTAFLLKAKGSTGQLSRQQRLSLETSVNNTSLHIRQYKEIRERDLEVLVQSMLQSPPASHTSCLLSTVM